MVLQAGQKMALGIFTRMLGRYKVGVAVENWRSSRTVLRAQMYCGSMMSTGMQPWDRLCS